MPGSLDEALECLRKDHEFLLKGDVFTEDVIETRLQCRYDQEVNPIRMRPTPLEYQRSCDIPSRRAHGRVARAAAFLTGERPSCLRLEPGTFSDRGPGLAGQAPIGLYLSRTCPVQVQGTKKTPRWNAWGAPRTSNGPVARRGGHRARGDSP